MQCSSWVSPICWAFFLIHLGSVFGFLIGRIASSLGAIREHAFFYLIELSREISLVSVFIFFTSTTHPMDNLALSTGNWPGRNRRASRPWFIWGK
ncbi:hypothetical protein V8F33_011584 [Rhypophila sp. PSN 637]